MQPFGYTGYQRDNIAGSYYAQAKEYQADAGRFVGIDRIVGVYSNPECFNGYIYCINMPMIKTDKTGFWFGIDDAIAAGVGAIAGVVSQVASDVVTSIVTQEIHISSWQDYVGSAVGGAAGGVTTLYAGPVVGAAVSGGTTTLVSEGIKAVTEPDYDKSIQSVLVEAGQDALLNGAFGFVFNGLKIKGNINTDPLAKIGNSYKYNYKNLLENPRIQRLLNSNRKYYINKGLKELMKAKKIYIQDVLELSEEAFKGAVRPIEILKSICPNIPDFIEEFIQDKDVWLEVSCDN
ncbi:RHS repeat-associated core domain-containing protein [Lachnoclostridium sp. An76]|uniref:RHS repeat-associated core domain-containing protein n=1 Tax=Lachnoclostridium sp. An76 TaxID=1965654 RepID=UPI000B396888|nr:RHS repeat-associated core domain-containing protein [Lachnoclostridium sp. An76]OUN34746.1 hypothetical protein B5G27_08490 [Lachnoclostridium sp. An76]